MGTLENCIICDLPVLELAGQFELLQPYLLQPGDPALALFGEVHTPCFTGSPFREAWVRSRIEHFRGARGYELASETEGWTILRHPRLRELLAFHVDGASIAPARATGRVTSCAGGGYLSVETDFYLTLDDRELVAEAQRALTHNKRFPLARVVDQLGIRDRLQWPMVLDTGEYVFSRQLQRDWSETSFAARLSYQTFLPEVVLAVWKQP